MSAAGFVAQAKPVLDPLEREQREIERRRARYMDRAKRVLHAKTRIIGIDKDALSAQAEEKRQKAELERDRDREYDDMTLRHSQMVTDQVVQMERDKRRRAEELMFFRKEQEKEKRLTDLATKARDIAPHPNEDTLFMKFPGEDLYKKDRVKVQQTQQQDWIAQQLAILRDREERERQEEAEYAAHQAAILELKRDVELEQNLTKMQRNQETKETNHQLHAEKTDRERRTAAEEAARADLELRTTLSSALMTEAVPQSAFGPHRIVPYAYKGMTTDQRQAILNTQREQQSDAAIRREQQAQEEREWAAQQEEVRRLMVRAAREKASVDLQHRLTLKDERAVQKREKDLRTQHLDKVVYQNPVHPSYFEQFGTSHR